MDEVELCITDYLNGRRRQFDTSTFIALLEFIGIMSDHIDCPDNRELERELKACYKEGLQEIKRICERAEEGPSANNI